MFSIRQEFTCGCIAAFAACFLTGCSGNDRDVRALTGCSGNDRDESVTASLQTFGNLCVISTSMFDYHDRYGHLPPAYVLGADGKPAHSWRVLLLQFIDLELFQQYNFNEPWNGPNNRKLADKMPGQYRQPYHTNSPRNKSFTSFVVLVGAKTAFPGDKTVKLADITDGRDNTILVAEAEGFNIHWMEPRDWDVDAFPIKLSDVKTPGFSSHNRHGPHIALADGTRMILDFNAPVDQLMRMSTIAGGEEVNLDLVYQIKSGGY